MFLDAGLQTPKDSPASALHLTGRTLALQIYAAMPLYIASGDLNSGLQACLASTVSNESFPQPQAPKELKGNFVLFQERGMRNIDCR